MRSRVAGNRDQQARPARRAIAASGIADDERNAEAHLQQRGRVDADAEERDMGERELAGPAEQQVEPERQDRVHHQHVAEVEEILRQQQRQQEAERQQQRSRRRLAGELAVHAHTFLQRELAEQALRAQDQDQHDDEERRHRHGLRRDQDADEILHHAEHDPADDAAGAG